MGAPGHVRGRHRARAGAEGVAVLKARVEKILDAVPERREGGRDKVKCGSMIVDD